jgi:hypothetical protein
MEMPAPSSFAHALTRVAGTSKGEWETAPAPSRAEGALTAERGEPTSGLRERGIATEEEVTGACSSSSGPDSF